MAKSSKRKLQNAFSQMQPSKKKEIPTRSVKKVRPVKEQPISMKSQNKKTPEKKGLHPRNLHRGGYNFEKLILATPSLKPFVKPNPYGNLSIDFNDPSAVKLLNLALLQAHYNIESWDIPEGYLCPPIPGRADYIHYLADLLESDGKKETQRRVLDIGTGANGIYPIIGIQAYGWNFVATDIDPISLKNVEKISIENPSLSLKLELRLQSNPQKIFDGIIKPTDHFDLTMCNPPFHSSLSEAHAGSKEKLKNLAKNRVRKGHDLKQDHSAAVTLNFGGQKAELWCKGGEQKFLSDMIRESKGYADQCIWFTSLISKKENLKPCYDALRKVGAITVKTIPMSQGNKITRILAWTFTD